MARVAAIAAAALLTATLGAPVVFAGEVTVRIGSSLDPASLRVGLGTTVTWVNEDGERHRVRSTSGPFRIDSGNLEPGERYSVRFETSGTWQYEDHRNRELAQYHGTVTVVDGAVDAPADDGAAAAAPMEASVRLAGRAFSPPDVTIAAGGTVRWTNDDDRDHTVTGADGGFGSSVLGSGDAFSETFERPGTYRYLCAIHPEMTGAVTVEAQAAADPPSPEASPVPAPSADTGTSIEAPDASTPPPDALAAAPVASGPPAASEPITPDTAQVALTQPDSDGELVRQLLVLSIVVAAVVVFAGIVRSVAEPRR